MNWRNVSDGMHNHDRNSFYNILFGIFFLDECSGCCSRWFFEERTKSLDLDFTGENQSAWWLIENKILIVYTTLINYNEYVTTLKVWRYKKGKGFELIL